MEFKGNVIIYYKLKTLTGLHIGGSKDTFEIGGLDNPVIKLPSTMRFESVFKNEHISLDKEQPYIPGSSLKGKIRSLLEWKYGDIDFETGKGGKKFEIQISEDIKRLRKLFGVSPTGGKEEDYIKSGLFPVRIRVFDAYPLINDIETELKYENSINRITSSANPRNFERVPAGTEFEGKIVIKLFSEDDAQLLKLLAEGFSLLEDDYLGGGGSRGSGRIKFEKFKVFFRGREYYTDKKEKLLIADSEINSLFNAVPKLEELIRGT